MKSMPNIKFIISVILLTATTLLYSQSQSKASLSYRGQLSVWGQYSPDIENAFRLGGRYIPQLNLNIPLNFKTKIDFELSANIYGDIVFQKRDLTPLKKWDLAPFYRAWMRYSTQQMEVRLGLQKINFGSAQILRPLMWFDSMDARDPLMMTDGVWGGLFRYYFKNNANIWGWVLYGNKERKGWEILQSYTKFPEFGGRAQFPVNRGEIAISYNFRKAENLLSGSGSLHPENRIGLDLRLDREVGLWFESSWTITGGNIGEYRNQEMITLGGDYTLDVGNGIGLTFEQLFYSFDEKAFNFKNIYTFSAIMATYPLSIFDDLSAIIYYNWKDHNIYNLINWQHHFKHLSLHTIFYWNPDNSSLPLQSGGEHFMGKGIRIMLVWDH